MITDFVVEKKMHRLTLTVLEKDGKGKNIYIEGHADGDILTLYTEKLYMSELTDKEIEQVKKFVKSRWDIIIN